MPFTAMDRAKAIILGCASPLADAPGYNIKTAPVGFFGWKIFKGISSLLSP
jgi:hypothetical protein